MPLNEQQQKIRLAVIIGSTREGRFADRIAKWFLRKAQQRDDLQIDLIDLAETQLPNDMPKASHPAVESFRARITAADAFVVITPEYNHAYPGQLKIAIDYAYEEWHAKPVAFVSYGGVSGGLRAVEQLRPVFAELHATTIRETVSFHGAFGRFDEDGNLQDSERADQAAAGMLERLVWWATALRAARKGSPYAA